MRLTILRDNTALIDRYLLAEPGFSALVETGGLRILFDTGYSGVFLENARRLGLDLDSLTHVVLSHCHLDHTWGLDSLVRHYTELDFAGRPRSRPQLLAHSRIMDGVCFDDCRAAGVMLSEAVLARHFTLGLQDGPVWLDRDTVLLGQIPRRNGFEARTGLGFRQPDGAPDWLPDDTALACRTAEGLVIITGCSHSGICNIVDYARELCGEDRIADLVGGFHLLEPSQDLLEGTAGYLERLSLRALHPCHCTDFRSRMRLARSLPLGEIGVGTSLSYASPGEKD